MAGERNRGSNRGYSLVEQDLLRQISEHRRDNDFVREANATLTEENTVLTREVARLRSLQSPLEGELGRYRAAFQNTTMDNEALEQVALRMQQQLEEARQQLEEARQQLQEAQQQLEGDRLLDDALDTMEEEFNAEERRRLRDFLLGQNLNGERVELLRDLRVVLSEFRGTKHAEAAEKALAVGRQRVEASELRLARERERVETAEAEVIGEKQRTEAAEKALAEQKRLAEAAEAELSGERQRAEVSKLKFAKERERAETAEAELAEEKQRTEAAKGALAEEQKRSAGLEAKFERVRDQMVSETLRDAQDEQEFASLRRRIAIEEGHARSYREQAERLETELQAIRKERDAANKEAFRLESHVGLQEVRIDELKEELKKAKEASRKRRRDESDDKCEKGKKIKKHHYGLRDRGAVSYREEDSGVSSDDSDIECTTSPSGSSSKDTAASTSHETARDGVEERGI